MLSFLQSFLSHKGHLSAQSFFMAHDSIDDALHSGLEDATRHSEVQAHIAFSVADEEAVTALKKHSRFIGKEAGHIVHIGQVF